MAIINSKQRKNKDIADYINAQEEKLAKICKILRLEIDKTLTESNSEIYYAMPVWFIDDNPIVGLRARLNDVNLLFWSGQLFKTKGLIAAGKYKDAQIKYEMCQRSIQKQRGNGLTSRK